MHNRISSNKQLLNNSSILSTNVAGPGPVVGWLHLASLVVEVAAVLAVRVVVGVFLVSHTEVTPTSLQ